MNRFTIAGHAAAIGLLASTALAAMPAAAEPSPPAPVKPKPGEKPTKGKPARLTPDRILRARNALRPQWGNIRTFWGETTPFWGNIRTFWGDVSPYEGDLSAFWGNIRTFNDGSDAGAVTPLWGNIRTFAGEIGASWGNIRTFWDAAGPVETAPDDYVALAAKLSAMVDQSEAFWGATIEAQSGKTFMATVGKRTLLRYGIDLADPQSLAAIDPATREQFFLDWYDGLMNYSGADRVDHWMKQVRWTPALTQTLGAGADTTIGLLDFRVTGDEERNLVKVDGIAGVHNGHGSAVVSLLVAAHDGKGVMGIAPKAKVVAYNPFDETLTAGWEDIRKGVVSLSKGGASIINLSLGVPGWTLNPDWNGVFTEKQVRDVTKNRVFVFAAGNDGISQSADIAWAKDNPAFIVVGSVDPNSNISGFSNRPGTTCLIDGAECKPDSDRLMNHFLVAPGELILVSDGNGGTRRLSGTSFAAPLVSGTIALIHDRWPWLANRPKDTVNIVLKSARDLGAPGVDPVYGWGELDVTAALSPLDWNKLRFKQYVDGKLTDIPIRDLRNTSAATRATWEPKGVYFSLFEDTGDSYRDFQVPMSSRLANQTVSVNGSAEQFMGYLTERFSSWLGAPRSFAGSIPTLGFAGGSNGFTTTASNGVETTLTMAPRATRIGFHGGDIPFQSALRIASADGGVAFLTGNGNAAPAIAGASGFAATTDFDVQSGGANPFVGLASGGAYAQVEMRLAPGLTVAQAMTQRTLRRTLVGMTAEQRAAFAPYGDYDAAALTTTLRYQAHPAVATSVTYTQLHEARAILGMQSGDRGDLPDGSVTDAVTVTNDVALSPTLTLSGTATLGRTRVGDPTRAAIAVGAGGMRSSAFQLALGKDHVLDGQDRMRLTFAQPMHVEGGGVDVSTVGVIDRATGEIGTLVQRGAIAAAPRRYVTELVYGRDLAGGLARVSVFGRAIVAGDPADAAPLTVGSSFRLAF